MYVVCVSVCATSCCTHTATEWAAQACGCTSITSRSHYTFVALKCSTRAARAHHRSFPYYVLHTRHTTPTTHQREWSVHCVPTISMHFPTPNAHTYDGAHDSAAEPVDVAATCARVCVCACALARRGLRTDSRVCACVSSPGHRFYACLRRRALGGWPYTKHRTEHTLAAAVARCAYRHRDCTAWKGGT